MKIEIKQIDPFGDVPVDIMSRPLFTDPMARSAMRIAIGHMRETIQNRRAMEIRAEQIINQFRAHNP